MLASAILLSWKRPENLPAIVDALRRQPRIGEILVWNNAPNVSITIEGAEVVYAPRNLQLLPRLALALLARHPLIWFQDDDLVLTLEQTTQLFEAFDSAQREWAFEPIVGVQGRLVVGSQYHAENVFGQCDIVNQAMLFLRWGLGPALARLPSPFWAPGEVDAVEDDILVCLAQGRGRGLAVDVGPLDRRGAYDGHAWSRRPDHAARRQRAVDWMLSR